jgi:hypothetical protein
MAASDQLSQLTDRAKLAEQRIATAKQQAKADLEKSAESSRAAARARAVKLGESAKESQGKISSWWDEQQQAWNAHVDKMRQSWEERKERREAKADEKQAERAEADASFAIEFAYAAIEEAESAVLDAILTRVNADEAAAASPERAR